MLHAHLCFPDGLLSLSDGPQQIGAEVAPSRTCKREPGSHSDSHPDSLQAAVGAGVEDVREVRQRLVAIEAGIVKSQRQEDKRGVDLLHRLSESEVSAATGFQFI